MAALQCEICGGKLMAKSGGLFECEYCGMQYDKTRIQEMVQEIKGTVKVEGTVEVKGTVKIDGPVKVEGGVSAESLLKRGWMALEDEKWKEAVKAFVQVLDLEPENARAHLGRYFGNKNIRTMKEAEDKYEKFFYIPPKEKEKCPVCKGTKFVVKEDGLRVCYACGVRVEAQETRVETQRIRKLADPELAQWFRRMDAQIQQQKEESKRKEKEDAERAAEERRRSRKEALVRLPAIRQRIEKVQGKIFSASLRHTVGIKTNGTVVAVGDNGDGKCNVDGWRDVVAVCTDEKHTVGLKADGTVVVLGDWGYRQEDVSGWRDIVGVSTSQYHIVGLKSNGTVVAAGNMNKDRCEVGDWRNIVAIGACEEYTVGLKQDGTVVITNENATGMEQLEDWHSIIAIAVGHSHVVGLRVDGTVVAAGWDFYGSCNVNDWYDIVAIDAGSSHTVGLKADGTVVAAGDMSDGRCKVSGWRNVVAISAAPYHTAGVRSDGTVVMAGKSPEKWNTWKLFNDFDNLEQERKAAPGNREAHIARLAEIRSRVSIAQKGILAMGEYHDALIEGTNNSHSSVVR